MIRFEYKMKIIILLTTLLVFNAAFTFIYPTVSLDILTINKPATYTLFAMRNYDVSLNPTPYASQVLPNNATIVIIMPVQYNLTITIPVVNLFSVNGNPVANFTMSILSNNITISSSVLSNLSLANASITIANITNPYPAITTNPFVIVIGTDESANSSSSSVTLVPDNFQSCNIGFTPAYVNTTGKMLVTISPTNKILNNGYIQIQFPSTLQWSQDISLNHVLPIGGVNCSPITGQILTNTCNGQTTNEIVTFVITSINSTSVTQSFQFSIGQLFSPPTTNPPDTLGIISYSPDGYQIDTCTATITNLLPQELSLTLTPSANPMYINSLTSLTLTFTLADTISKTDYFQFVFPINSTFSFSAISSVNLQISSSAVSYIPANYTLVMRQSTSSSTKYAGTVCKITINTYTAPPNIKTTPFFTLQIYNSQNDLKMSGTATLTAAAKSYALTVVPQSYYINANTIYTFTLITADNLLASAIISVTFPVELSLSVTTNCLTANFSSPSSLICTLNGSNTVILSNLSTASISPGTYVLKISSLVNTGWALATSSFSMNIYYSNSTSEMVATASAPGVILTPKAIAASSISVSQTDYHVNANPVSLNITFISIDAIPSAGLIYLTFPPQIVFVISYIPQCILFSGSSSSMPSCSILNQTVSFTVNNPISSGTTVIIQLINCCVNPKSTRPSSFFKLYTYSQSMYMIDYSNSSCQITNFIPIQFFNLLLTASSSTNNATCSYSFNIQQTNSWDANSSLIIQVPATISTNGNIYCLNTTSSTNLTCSLIANATGTFINVILSNSSSSFLLTINSLINPPSLQQSSAFTLTTYTSDGYVYATDNSTLTITNTAPSSFISLAYSFSSQIYNTTSNLTLTIANILSNSNLYVLANALEIVNTSIGNISCTSPLFLLTCYMNGSSLFITPTNSSVYFQINTTISINNLFIPLANITGMPFSSFSNGYLESTYSSITFTTMCSLPCYTCLSINSSSTCLSCYSTTLFTSLIYFYQQNCYSKCPIGSFSASGSLICSVCSFICTQCTLTNNACTECNTTGSYPVLYLVNNTCLTSCPNGTYQNNSTNLTKYTPVCSACISPCGGCTSPTICTSCSNSSLFFYQSQCLDSCPLAISIGNVTNMVCQPCASVCATCVNAPYACLSCNSSVAPLFIASNQTCVSACPTPLVSDNNNTLCVPCSSPCNTCSQVKTNCTSCLNGTNTYLSAVTIGMCLSSCEQYYYANITTLICDACSSVKNLNCSNCLNSTYCITCNIGYVMFLPSHSCLAQTPNGYLNISGIAVACNSSCSGCTYTVNNCTACIGNLSLYILLGIGYCQSACPSQTLSISNVCVGCTYPCRDCSSILTNCTSCVTGYLQTNGTITLCLAVCPNTTFINSSSLTCQSCQSPCSSCLASASVCTSCLTGNGSLYNNSCYINCPNYTVLTVLTNTCDACINPCQSCSNLINNCTSCVTGSYYFSSTNRCYTSCPVNISIVDTNNLTLNCLPCTSNCFSCSGSQNNCTSCALNYSYFNFTCILVCPIYYFSSAGFCILCINNCFTCSSSILCLSCINGTYLYQNQCLASCPVSSAIITNGSCTACSNQCLNCSVNNICYSCPSSLALYNGSCLSVCPSPLTLYFNSSDGQLACYTSSEIAGEQLQQSLSASTILPMPFTIITTFLFMCSLMSKLQNINTYTTGIGYSLYGCAQIGSLGYLFYIYNRDEISSSDYSTYFLLIIIGLGINGGINLISLIFVTPFLCSDSEFNNWLTYRRRGTPPKDGSEGSETETMRSKQKQNDSAQCWSHTFTFVFFTLVSSFTSYKFRIIIFTKLFRFNCLSAHLQNIHGFRAFNILSFFGLAHEGLACYVTIKMLFIYSYGQNSRLYLAVIDCLVVTITAFIFSLLATQKQQDFFKIQNSYQGGVDLGHRKKDKHRLKNLKIDEKRYNSLDSRDKLADIHDSNSDLEQQIIVNHNINMPHGNKKDTGFWVQKLEKSTNQKIDPRQVGNIFEGNLDDESINPIYVQDPVQLYHTSVRPKYAKKQASRISNWVKVDREQNNGRNKLKTSQVEQNVANSKISGISAVSQLKNKNLNIESSIVKIQFSENLPKNINSNERMLINEQKVNYNDQPPIVIKQTQSQNFSDSVKEIPRHEVQGRPVVQIIASETKQVKDVINLQDFSGMNHTIGQGQIMGSDPQKSFQSILPFVHQNGVLRQKTSKIKKQISKKQNSIVLKNDKEPQADEVENIEILMIEKVDIAVGGNSLLLDEPSKSFKTKNQNPKQQDLQNMLDISEIKLTHPPQISNIKQPARLSILESVDTKPPVSQEIIQPVQPMLIKQVKLNDEKQIQVEGLQSINCVDVSIQRTHRVTFASALQIYQKIQPNSQKIVPVMHAPKVYRSQKNIQGQNMKQMQFDDKINHFQKKLTKMKEQIAEGNTRLAQKKKEQFDINQNKRSKKYITKQIEQALKLKQAKSQKKTPMKVTQSEAENGLCQADAVEKVQICGLNQNSNYRNDGKNSRVSHKDSNLLDFQKNEISVVDNCNNMGNMAEKQKSGSEESQSNRNIFDQCLYTQTEDHKQQMHLQEVNHEDKQSFLNSSKQLEQSKQSRTIKYQNSNKESLKLSKIKAPSEMREKESMAPQIQQRTYKDVVIDNQSLKKSHQKQSQNQAENHSKSLENDSQDSQKKDSQNQQSAQKQGIDKSFQSHENQINQNRQSDSDSQQQTPNESQNDTSQQESNQISQKGKSNSASQKQAPKQSEESFEQNINQIYSVKKQQVQVQEGQIQQSQVNQEQEQQDYRQKQLTHQQNAQAAESENRTESHHQDQQSHSQKEQLQMENKQSHQDNIFDDINMKIQQEEQQAVAVVDDIKQNENIKEYRQQVNTKQNQNKKQKIQQPRRNTQSVNSQKINQQRSNKIPSKNVSLQSSQNDHDHQLNDNIIKYEVEKEQRIIKDDQSSAKNNQFTLQNYERNYQEDDSSKNHSRHIESIELRKTSKKFPIQIKSKIAKLPDQESDYKPIEFVGGKQYFISEEPFDENPVIEGRRMKKQPLNKANQYRQSAQKTSEDHKQIINLLRNVTRNSRSKNKLPKQERDQRILIKMDRQHQIPATRIHQNTNLIKKSVQKNKPLNNFTYEQKPDYYYQQDTSSKNNRASLSKNNTMNFLSRPNNALSSGREEKVNSAISIAQQRGFQPQINQQQHIRRSKPQQIREFNFGDEISSQVSNFNSQAQLYKWKQQFIHEKAYINLRPEHEINDLPEQPLVNKLSRFHDEGEKEFQERAHSKEGRGNSRNSKPRSKRKNRNSRDSELRKIYGRQ